ncbi:MAG: hypothetical protein ACOC2U_00085 [bacterium]
MTRPRKNRIIIAINTVAGKPVDLSNLADGTVLVYNSDTGAFEMEQQALRGTVDPQTISISEVPTGIMNGSNNIFILETTPVDGTVQIYLNGKRLKPDTDYTINGREITFTNSPLYGDDLLIDYFKSIPSQTFNEEPSGTIDGSNTDFNLAYEPINGTVRVFENGRKLKPGTDYIVSSSKISFTLAPVTGSTLLVDYDTSKSDVVYNEVPTGTMDGSNTDFNLANSPLDGTVRVYNNSRYLHPDEYSVNGSILTLVEAPQYGDHLLVDYDNTAIDLVYNEAPIGIIDGSNKEFNLANIPASNNAEVIYINGIRIKPDEDYTIDGNTITFTLAPEVGDKILVNYKYFGTLNLLANNMTVTTNNNQNITANGTTQSVKEWFDWINEEFENFSNLNVG